MSNLDEKLRALVCAFIERWGRAAARRYIRRVWPLIEGTLPGSMTAEGLMAAVAREMEREPWLARVTPESLARAVVTAERLGLTLGGPDGQVRLMPYRHRESGRLECLLRMGWERTEKILRKAER